MPEMLKLFAATPKGMEQLLGDEIKRLGGIHMSPLRAGVEFTGTLETAYKLCLWSRVANRVLLPLPSFEAKTPEALYDAIRAIDWSEHMAADGTLAVDFNISRSKIKHSHYAALKVKDAICDQFLEKFDERPSVDTEQPDLRINCYLSKNVCRISIDLSGESLHRRGYRTEGGGAPLKENLAAAILLYAGWPEVAAEGGSLVDPMCGSGTLLIEGAMIAGDIAPGLLRDYFGFIRWKKHDPILWASLRHEAEKRREAGLENLPAIRGSDIDGRMISISRDNVTRAGLDEHIVISACEVSNARPGDLKPGLLVTNPPYGERLAQSKDLGMLYRQLGTLIKGPFGGWRASLFTSQAKLLSFTGLYTQEKHVLFNGAIKCELFNYPAGKSSGVSEHALTDAQGAPMLANRLRKNLKHLGKWARREEVDCYRLYDADLPEYALAVDLYHGEKLWVHVQEYQAPASVEPAKAAQRLHDAVYTIKEVLELGDDQLFLKQRRRQKGTAQYEKYDQREQFFEVREGNIKCLVNLSDYLDTGLFLDHRITRTLLEQQAKGTRFLNLFAYTGVATVHAAVGGAETTVTVDMSRTYLDWARDNLKLNGISGLNHRFIQANCIDWVTEQAKHGEKFDLIFLAPPTFSNSKRMEDNFDVQRDHVALLKEVCKLLSTDGTLIFSNNHRKFKMDSEALPELEIMDITARTIPEDFKRNPKIHNCWQIKHAAR